MEHC
jgi:serine/threonine protein kinase